VVLVRLQRVMMLLGGLGGAVIVREAGRPCPRPVSNQLLL